MSWVIAIAMLTAVVVAASVSRNRTWPSVAEELLKDGPPFDAETRARWQALRDELDFVEQRSGIAGTFALTGEIADRRITVMPRCEDEPQVVVTVAFEPAVLIPLGLHDADVAGALRSAWVRSLRDRGRTLKEGYGGGTVRFRESGYAPPSAAVLREEADLVAAMTPGVMDAPAALTTIAETKAAGEDCMRIARRTLLRHYGEHPGALRAAAALAASSDPEDRLLAFRGQGTRGHAGLRQLATEPSVPSNIRERAFELLRPSLTGEEADALLLPVLQEPARPPIARSFLEVALRELAARGHTSVTHWLARHVDHATVLDAIFISELARRVGSPEALGAIVPFLAHDEDAVRRAALEAISHAPSADVSGAAEPLLIMLLMRRGEPRIFAVDALAVVGTLAAVPALLDVESGDLADDVRTSIELIQARCAGGVAGGLSVAREDDRGGLALAAGSDGELSVADDPGS